MSLDRIKEIAQKVREAFEKDNLWADVFWTKRNGEYCLEIDIERGDWKHDHLRAEWVVGEVVTVNRWEEVVTEEDGSDCYSAIHYAYV